MFKNLKEEDKKKIYTLGVMSLVCIIGLVMFSGSPGDEKEKEAFKDSASVQAEDISTEDIENLEGKLKNILGKIEGAGEVDVMITFESSEQIEPAFNTNATKEETTEKDAQGGERTVVTSSENKTMITSSESKPVIIKTSEPKIKGVIVVASGAGDPGVKQTLYSAVQTSLQISGHQVEIYSK